MHYNEFFKNKRVLVTGHTGFKGSWLTMMLISLGADVIGYALDPTNRYDNFEVLNLTKSITDIRGDIRDLSKLASTFEHYKPDVVFHLAAQPLVRKSYTFPRETMEVNLMGTVNVLEAFRMSKNAESLVVITSDKVYENREWIWSYRENDQIGGYDPYSASKGAVELICSAYQRSFFNPDAFEEHKKVLATVRAGNVIGGGDWSKDRIIPDVIRALELSKPVKIRNPDSIRPWQHVMEPLHGYLLLASKMQADPKRYSGPWNFGPGSSSHIKVKDLVVSLIRNYGSGEIMLDDQIRGLHESKFLALDNAKASMYLKWESRLNLEDTIALTVEWYKNYTKQNIIEIVKNQIDGFLNKGLDDVN
jgi:CDP-glucose 4,6-dehydratase